MAYSDFENYVRLLASIKLPPPEPIEPNEQEARMHALTELVNTLQQLKGEIPNG